MARNEWGVVTCPSTPAAFDDSIFFKLPDRVLRPGGLELTNRAVKYCGFTDSAIVVDVGCGLGITVEYLQETYGLNAVGIDSADDLLQQWRTRPSRLSLLQADANKMPFADGAVDGVLAECSLSVVPDVGKVLKEIYRILAFGGKLAITDIFLRDATSVSQADNHSWAGCIAGVMNYGELAQKLVESGFRISIWEDHSALLKEFIARFIMNNGSLEELWQCIPSGKKAGQASQPARNTVKLGYFLLVAEK
jgi:ubiquinone/menaquinone biosynthesis C-methylase UbiE